ncbi:MAG: L-lactate permease [Syntrophomonadaceae bacterium]|jgi:lactate permease
MDVLLTLVPIVAVLALLIFAKWPADISGLAGWILALVISMVFFHTSLEVGLTGSLAGIIASFPVSLMVATSIFQITFLESTGALKRIVVFVKTIAKRDRAVQIMIINMGIGTLLVSVGATPLSILPPIMVALGYSTFVAIALPALGYDALCTYALLGAPLVVFADMTGTSLNQSALVFAQFMPVISTVIGFGMLWLVGGVKQIKEGFVPCVLAGLTMGLTAMAVAHIGRGIVLTGVIAGMVTIVVMLIYMKLIQKPIIDRSCITTEDMQLEKSMPLLSALSPWLILVGTCLFINFCPPLFNILFNDLAMPIQIIPGEKPIMTRMLWNAYTWVIISTLVALPFIKPSREQWKEIMTKWYRRAPRPVFSAAIFFAIAYIMTYSGFTASADGWTLLNPDNNMLSVLGTSSAEFFKGLYPIAAGFLGLLGGFVSGSEASTIALFTKYHLLTSKLLSVDPLVVTAGTAIAGGLASVISPAKLQNAAATIDALGEESRVIKVAVVIATIFTGVAAVLTFIWA